MLGSGIFGAPTSKKTAAFGSNSGGGCTICGIVLECNSGVYDGAINSLHVKFLFLGSSGSTRSDSLAPDGFRFLTRMSASAKINNKDTFKNHPSLSYAFVPGRVYTAVLSLAKPGPDRGIKGYSVVDVIPEAFATNGEVQNTDCFPVGSFIEIHRINVRVTSGACYKKNKSRIYETIATTKVTGHNSGKGARLAEAITQCFGKTLIPEISWPQDGHAGDSQADAPTDTPAEKNDPKRPLFCSVFPCDDMDAEVGGNLPEGFQGFDAALSPFDNVEALRKASDAPLNDLCKSVVVNVTQVSGEHYTKELVSATPGFEVVVAHLFSATKMKVGEAVDILNEAQEEEDPAAFLVEKGIVAIIDTIPATPRDGFVGDIIHSLSLSAGCMPFLAPRAGSIHFCSTVKEDESSKEAGKLVRSRAYFAHADLASAVEKGFPVSPGFVNAFRSNLYIKNVEQTAEPSKSNTEPVLVNNMLNLDKWIRKGGADYSFYVIPCTIGKGVDKQGRGGIDSAELPDSCVFDMLNKGLAAMKKAAEPLATFSDKDHSDEAIDDIFDFEGWEMARLIVNGDISGLVGLTPEECDKPDNIADEALRAEVMRWNIMAKMFARFVIVAVRKDAPRGAPDVPQVFRDLAKSDNRLIGLKKDEKIQPIIFQDVSRTRQYKEMRDLFHSMDACFEGGMRPLHEYKDLNLEDDFLLKVQQEQQELQQEIDAKNAALAGQKRPDAPVSDAADEPDSKKSKN